MTVTELNHINIRTPKVEETRRFYEDVLGFHVGPRPPLNMAGYWLYCGNQAVVHIIGFDEKGDPPRTNRAGNGPGLDHVGFFANDVEAWVTKLERLGVPYQRQLVAAGTLHQLFFDDPNGVTIELGIPVEATAATRTPASATA